MRINAHTMEIWAHLPVAQALFETGSMALAADHLRVNRTTVDRRLRALEEALGGAVFERNGGRFYRPRSDATFSEGLKPRGRPWVFSKPTHLTRTAAARSG